jgi:hypothetical protein
MYIASQSPSEKYWLGPEIGEIETKSIVLRQFVHIKRIVFTKKLQNVEARTIYFDKDQTKYNKKKDLRFFSPDRGVRNERIES